MSYSARLELEIDSRSGEQRLRQLERRLDGVERSGDKVAGSLRGVEGRFGTLKTVATSLGGALATLAAGGAGFGAIANQSAQAAREIQNLSRISNTSVEQFQKMSYGAARYGVEQGKLADILRDTQDRIGDFLQTGAGEFVDFFEQVAGKSDLTAQKLAELSGPDALQAIYNALDQANLSASETTFYMEALASDATELIPLLRDGGRGFREMANEADRLNIVLSEQDIRSLADLRGEFSQLQKLITSSFSRQIAQNSEAIKETIDGISGAVVALNDSIEDGAIAQMVEWLGEANEQGSQFVTEAQAISAQGVSAFRSVEAALLNVEAGLLDMRASGAEAFAGLVEGAADAINSGLIPIQQTLNYLDHTFANLLENVGNLLGPAGTNFVNQAQEIRDGISEAAGIDVGMIITNAEALREQADAARASADAMQDGGEAAAQAGAIGYKPLSEWLFEVSESAGGAIDSNAVLAKASADTTSELDRQAESAQGLLDELFPLEKQQREYREGVDTLTSALMRGEISQQRYEEALKRHEDSYRSNQNAAEAYGLEVDNLADRADPMADAFQEATRRIDETFADAFTGAFDSFDDFADQLLDGFKRLLGELAYQATLRPIVVGFTADMQRGLGLPGQSGASLSGGISQAFSTGKSLWTAGTSLFGGGSTVSASSLGMSGGVSGTAIASAGQVAAGAQPWYAGAMQAAPQVAAMYALQQGADALLESVGAYEALGIDTSGPAAQFGGQFLGLGGKVIGAGIDTLDIFGEKYSGEDPTGTLKTVNDYGSAGRAGFEREAFGESALGQIGFARESRDIDTLFGDRGDFDAAREYAQTLAQLDNAVAALADSEAELDEMRRAAAGRGLSSIEEVDQRYIDLLSIANGEMRGLLEGFTGNTGELVQFGATLDSVWESLAGNQQALADVRAEVNRYSSDVEDSMGAAKSMALAAQAMALLESGGERLNLQFDATAQGAIHAASELQAMAGGIQNLTGLQQSYYQAFYSQAEQAAHLQDDLREQFAALNLEMPETRAGFRDLVEAQDLNTESGREAYLGLLNLSGAFDQVAVNASQIDFSGIVLPGSTVDSIQGALSVYEQVSTTASDVAEQRQAQLEDERRAIQSLQSLLDELTIGDASALSSAGRLSAAQGQWERLVARASGNPGAIGDLSGASRSYLDLARGNASTALEYARVFGQVTGDIAGLEGEYGESVHELGSIESIASDQLRMQEQARGTLIDQLTTQIGMLDGIHTFSALLESLPAGIADRLEGIISAETPRGDVLPDGEYVDTSGLSPAGQAINALYQDALGRNADQDGLAYYLERLANGGSLSDIRDDLEWAGAHGAHADGLGRVPFDGYRAVLHRDETVLPANIANMYRDAAPGGQGYGAMIAELKAMTRRLERLEGYARTTADSSSQTANNVRRWEFAGMPETRT